MPEEIELSSSDKVNLCIIRWRKQMKAMGEIVDILSKFTFEERKWIVSRLQKGIEGKL